MLIPLRDERPQPLRQMVQIRDVDDAQSLARQTAEPLLMAPILLHILSSNTDK